jgi:hypothetical protein
MSVYSAVVDSQSDIAIVKSTCATPIVLNNDWSGLVVPLPGPATSGCNCVQTHLQ